MNILITGATGNVGQAIVQHLQPNADQHIFVATRNINTKENELFFDFDNLEQTKKSLLGIDILFLLRPPHIADTNKYFKPLIEIAKEANVQHILFLSVQGAENSSFIPHSKIEKLLIDSKLAYTFIRPSYFMQNLTNTLLEDIKKKNYIYLPSKKAKFLWVDVADIGKAIAAILKAPNQHQYKAYTITGTELLDFYQVCQLLSEQLDRKIEFISPFLIVFFFSKLRQGVPIGFIFVLIMLHYLPRFQQPAKISTNFNLLTNEQPNTVANFIAANKTLF